MKKILLFSAFLVFSFTGLSQEKKQEEKINSTLNKWHQAAAEADFETYFKLMTSDGVFIGTDATENWQYDEFREFSKPYFEKGKAWNFKNLDRNIYINEKATMGWFDELLDTQMGICRGSGVLKKEDDEWKIAHYVLSIAIPNENVEETTKMKKAFDDNLISGFSKQ